MTAKRKSWDKMSVDEKLEAIRDDTSRDLARVAHAVQLVGNRVLRIERHLGIEQPRGGRV
jgi:hypothetical protein